MTAILIANADVCIQYEVQYICMFPHGPYSVEEQVDCLVWERVFPPSPTPAPSNVLSIWLTAVAWSAAITLLCTGIVLGIILRDRLGRVSRNGRVRLTTWLQRRRHQRQNEDEDLEMQPIIRRSPLEPPPGAVETVRRTTAEALAYIRQLEQSIARHERRRAMRRQYPRSTRPHPQFREEITISQDFSAVRYERHYQGLEDL